MNYQRYFKPGRQLLLRAIYAEEGAERTEFITAFVVSLENEILIVSLPYGDNAAEQYLFEKDHSIEITTEVMGMGIRATGTFDHKIDGKQIALKVNADLQMFQRRISERFDCQLGVRFSRAAKTLQTMRDIWEKNIKVLHSPEAPLVFDGFKSCRLNISSGGIRFAVKPPIDQGDLSLVLINLEDGKPPVCAIAEAVWICIQNESAATAGMRFINILSEDQQRISDYIRISKAKLKKTGDKEKKH